MALQGYMVANAAFEVGYQSPSQFNREYSRFFGVFPARHSKNFRSIHQNESG
jgi:AraC-like DNA-binding protein